jgi:hypothetical protein
MRTGAWSAVCGFTPSAGNSICIQQLLSNYLSSVSLTWALALGCYVISATVLASLADGFFTCRVTGLD